MTTDPRPYEGSEVLDTVVKALDGARLKESEDPYKADAEDHDQGRDGDSGEDQGEDGVDGGANGGGEGRKKKKKKKKPKSKAKKTGGFKPNQGTIPEELPPISMETAEERARWERDIVPGYPTITLPTWGLLGDRAKNVLSSFWTPSCKRLELVTPRLRLRQVELGDLTAIRRIKTEPVVQKTQLYGSPSISDIKEAFLNRYVRSSDEFIFAITAINPGEIEVKPPENIKSMNRISNAEGYLGNIALSLEYSDASQSHLPRKGRVYTQPSFKDMDKAGVTGKLFYEIHPQLWGQGIMSEAFEEVLRFGMEEVGCTVLASDPTIGNDPSVKLCTKNGLKYTKTVQNRFNKPQLFHEITRAEWWTRNRLGKEISDHWGGKEVCRW
ncbi:hypothetical protein I316_03214 [Kwoniella heveanensis BCC8398]|uniref:N-acetyltransferase domain-containing protein n=1 Tax=Kwoniella heveanensis BCC8398 TaxID=1296120 RepID=A0A1B9GVW8_9TREE|nr:hypothetical protein I316_03214 [Kwoniella heveanensis BCC8398]